MKAHPAAQTIQINRERLGLFEQSLDPRRPETSAFPTRVLGYGEISTVLEIDLGAGEHLAYKRMPMFRTEQEFDRYAALYHDYLQVLDQQIHFRTVPGELVWVPGAGQNRVVAYIVQEKLPSACIGCDLIRHLPVPEVQRLVQTVLEQIARVVDFNRAHRGALEVAVDGQISNWAVLDYDPSAGRLPDEVQLTYFDTSTPFLSRDGKEQLDPELFLRSAPSFLVWILRLLFLKDVMTRYYDFRKVCVDIIANFYKEQCVDLIPAVVQTVNTFLAQRGGPDSLAPLTVKEISDYYREDATIWRLYLAFRKADRSLYRLLGKPYPYILPDRIKR